MRRWCTALEAWAMLSSGLLLPAALWAPTSVVLGAEAAWAAGWVWSLWRFGGRVSEGPSAETRANGYPE